METDMAISIVIAFSPRPREVVEIPFTVKRGCTIAQVLQSADFLAETMADGIEVAGFGVWGRKAGPSHILKDQDRLEIYRALTVDPKVARRERFAKQGAKKSAGLFATRRIGAKAGY
jgi:putative ubiquitin-RnfH superfamily antitoxin RatB of RatAB toxin-antitoxin module